MSIGNFELNGIESRSFKIIAKSVKRPILPPLKTRYSEISGKHGFIDQYENKYSTRELTMHIAYIGDSYVELRSRAREIAAWLNTDEWVKLIIDDEPDKYYLVRIYTGVDMETSFKFGEADIAFTCQPFAYALVDTAYSPTWDEADIPWLTDVPWLMDGSYQFDATGATSYSFDNPGTVKIGNDAPQKSKFKIEVTGSWTTLSLALNSKTLTYAAAGSGTLIIDNIEMEATLEGINVLENLSGDLDSFLHLVPGTNTIQIDGTGLNISVQLDFIPMWI